jgi:hypothetical protein
VCDRTEAFVSLAESHLSVGIRSRPVARGRGRAGERRRKRGWRQSLKKRRETSASLYLAEGRLADEVALDAILGRGGR